MKKLFKYVTPILVALISITVLFPATSLAVNTVYTIRYQVSPASLNVTPLDYLTRMTTNGSYNSLGEDKSSPDSCTAKDTDNYKFVEWVAYIDDEKQDDLPKGWTKEDDGKTLVFDPTIEGALKKSVLFVAEYEPITKSPTEPSDIETIEVLKVSATEATETVDKLEKGKEEILVTEAKEETTEDETTTETPETGDNNSTVVWIIIGAVALAAVIIAVVVLLTNKNKK